MELLLAIVVPIIIGLVVVACVKKYPQAKDNIINLWNWFMVCAWTIVAFIIVYFGEYFISSMVVKQLSDGSVPERFLKNGVLVMAFLFITFKLTCLGIKKCKLDTDPNTGFFVKLCYSVFGILVVLKILFIGLDYSETDVLADSMIERSVVWVISIVGMWLDFNMHSDDTTWKVKLKNSLESINKSKFICILLSIVIWGLTLWKADSLSPETSLFLELGAIIFAIVLCFIDAKFVKHK